jgi:spermidine/putrescine transport system permease protein
VGTGSLRWQVSALACYSAIIFLLLYLPIFVVAALAVNDAPVTGFPIKGFTLKLFEVVLSNDTLLHAMANSVALGVASATAATALALMLAIGFREGLKQKTAILYLLLVPVILPGVVAGAALFILFQLLGLPVSLWSSALCAHITCTLPFAFLNISARLHSFDRSLEEAAKDLGANTRQIVTRVILPVIRPAVIAAWLFAFSISFDEFVRTLLLTTYDRTLPVQFWYMVVEALSPEAPAMAVIIIAVSVAASFGAFAFAGNRRRIRSRMN